MADIRLNVTTAGQPLALSTYTIVLDLIGPAIVRELTAEATGAVADASTHADRAQAAADGIAALNVAPQLYADPLLEKQTVGQYSGWTSTLVDVVELAGRKRLKPQTVAGTPKDHRDAFARAVPVSALPSGFVSASVVLGSKDATTNANDVELRLMAFDDQGGQVSGADMWPSEGNDFAAFRNAVYARYAGTDAITRETALIVANGVDIAGVIAAGGTHIGFSIMTRDALDVAISHLTIRDGTSPLYIPVTSATAEELADAKAELQSEIDQISPVVSQNAQGVAAANANVDVLTEEVAGQLGGATLEPIDTKASGWLLPILDADGRIVGGFDASGKLVADVSDRSILPASAAPETATRNIVLLGDSLNSELGTADIGGPGAQVVNLSIGGQAREIYFRAGCEPVILTLAGNQIPASGPVAVTAYDIDLGYASNASAREDCPGVIAGVPGVLRGLGGGTQRFDGNYEFVRDEPGAAVTVPANAEFTSTQLDPYLDWIWVTSIGRNYFGTDRWQDQRRRLTDIRAMMERKTDPGARAIHFGVPNAQGEPSGSVIKNNRAYQAALGADFCDSRSFLIDEGIDIAVALGLLTGPTTQDNQDIANDVIPTSLTSDGLHRNATGEAVMRWLINSRLASAGWL